MLDAANMAVHVGDVRQTVVTTVDLAVRVSDVKEFGRVPQFHLLGVDGLAGFGRILEFRQHGHVVGVRLVHIAGKAVGAREVPVKRIHDFRADARVAGRRTAPTGVVRRRTGAQEALGFASIVVEFVFPPPQMGVIVRGSAIEVIPAVVVFVVVHVHDTGQTNLLQIACAGDGASLFTGLRQRGQQHGSQNRDDRDDHQKFNQGELQDFLHLFFLFLLNYSFSKKHRQISIYFYTFNSIFIFVNT